MKNKLIPILICISVILSSVHTADYRLTENVQKVVGNNNLHFIQPVWSPDGLRIAFTSPGYKGLWVIDANGMNMMQISDEIGAGFGFEWSPDAQAIVMRTAQYDGPFRNHAIKIFDLSNKQTIVLKEAVNRIRGLPKWTRDNNDIYFYDNKLEIISSGRQSVSKTSSPFVYSDREYIFVQYPGTDDKKSWSPFAGKEILNLEVSPDGTKVSFEILGGNLFVTNLDGTELRDLGQGHRAVWSPESSHLIYMVTADDGHEFLESELYVCRVADGERFQLTDTPEKMEMNPSWSPDGKFIAYDEYTEGAIFIVEIIPE